MNTNKIIHILFSVRADLLTKIGGDTLHIKHLQKLLTNSGHQVDLALNHDEHKVKNYDIVHFFNLSIIDHNYTIFKQAKQLNIKTCFTSIFQHPKRYDPFAPYSSFIPQFILEKSKLLLSISKFSTKLLFLSHHKLRKHILDQCDQIFCNSEQEIQDLESYYSLTLKDKSSIAIPSVDTENLQEISNEFLQKFHHKNYILIVGRIEKLKNQIRVIEALKDLKKEIIFIGKPNHNNKKYYSKFLQLVKKHKQVFYYPDLSRTLVLSAIKNAQLVIQASCVENFGFVSLEAHFFQTKLLVSRNSYFNSAMKTNYLEVDPYSISSIKSGALELVSNKKDTKAKHFGELLEIESSFLTNTLSTYLKILS